MSVDEKLTPEQKIEWDEVKEYCLKELRELAVEIGKQITDDELIIQIDRMKESYFKD